MTVITRIGRLCAHMARDDFEKTAEQCGAAELVSRIVLAVRAGADPAALEPDLDAVDEAFAQLGIDNVTTGSRAYHGFPGASGHPLMRARICPAARRCPRLELGPTSQTQVCALTNQPLIDIDVRS
jgi:hypothetical protein